MTTRVHVRVLVVDDDPVTLQVTRAFLAAFQRLVDLAELTHEGSETS